MYNIILDSKHIEVHIDFTIIFNIIIIIYSYYYLIIFLNFIGEKEVKQKFSDKETSAKK